MRGPEGRYQKGAVIASRYEVVRPLGEGSFGRVFEARDSVLGRQVAVKVLRTGDRCHRQRFKGEAQALARIDHECVVRVFEYTNDDDDDATPCLIMELVRGRSFEAYLNGYPCGDAPLPMVARVLTRALSGLCAIHHNGIVHRDLKPANLVLSERGGGTVVKIVDLGLAREGDVAALDATVDARQPSLHDSSTGFVGTPAYAAPEQVLPPFQVTRAADLFAMGVIAYRAFSGSFPYPVSSRAEYVEAMRGNSAPIPLRDSADRLDGQVAAIVERAIRRDPSERFHSAEDFLAELVQALPPDALLSEDALPSTGVLTFDGPRALGLVLRKIPAQPPLTGSNAAHAGREPVHVAVHPTTVEAFARFVRETGYVTYAERNARARTWKHPGFDQGDQHPVVCVTLDDARRYCEWAGLRLPSEREWCAAAFGNAEQAYPWGDALPDEGRLWWSRGAVCVGTAAVTAHPLGASPSQHLGMAGNIWEWTSSPSRTRGACMSDPGSSGDYAIRGGGWRDRDPRVLTRKYANQCHSSSSENDLGFRCALGPEER